MLLSLADNDNTNANPGNVIVYCKRYKLNIPVVTVSGRDNQKLSKRLSKEFERSVYWNEYKTKSVDKKNKK